MYGPRIQMYEVLALRCSLVQRFSRLVSSGVVYRVSCAVMMLRQKRRRADVSAGIDIEAAEHRAPKVWVFVLEIHMESSAHACSLCSTARPVPYSA